MYKKYQPEQGAHRYWILLLCWKAVKLELGVSMRSGRLEFWRRSLIWREEWSEGEFCS